MKRVLSEEDEFHGHYEAAELSDGVKTFMGALYRIVLDDDITVKRFRGWIEDAGYGASDRSLRRWAGLVDRGMPPGSAPLSSGRPTAFTDEEYHLLVGYVLWMNEKRLKVSADIANDWVKAKLDIIVDRRTIDNCFKAACLKTRLVTAKTLGASISVSDLAKIYVNAIESYRKAGYLSGIYYHMDSAYTSDGTHRETTIVPEGSAGPKLVDDIVHWTDCIVTIYDSEGNAILVVLFHHDKKLKDTSSFKAIFKKFNFPRAHFVYVEPKKARSRYCRENNDIIAHCLKVANLPRGSVLFTDDGGAYKKKKVV